MADVDVSFPDEISSTENGVYLDPSGPTLDGIPLSELEAQPDTGPRPISLPTFVDRAEYPILFDPVPTMFVKY